MERGQLLVEVGQRRHQRGERERLAAELHALAVQHEEPAARVPFELPREPGLSDAGLAGQQHDLRMPELRRGEHVVEQPKRLVPADDRLAGNPAHCAPTISLASADQCA